MAMRPGSLYQLTFPEISIRQRVSLFSARRSPTWFRWRKSGRRAESDSGGDGLLANPRIVARRRFQSSGRRQRNRSGGFCCFSPSKSREKSFLCTFGAKSTKSLRTSFSAGLRDPRRCTGRARSSLCVTPWRTRRCPHPLFPRQTRVRIRGAANGGIIYMAMRFGCPYQLTFSEISIRQCVSLFSARRSPTWFRWRKSGRRAESASGGDGLLANPRIVARRRFQTSGRRQRNRSGGFCCFSPPKSREKSFFRRFLRKPKKDVERLFAASRHRKQKKPPDNQQRILPYSKAPIPSICRANSLRAVRS